MQTIAEPEFFNEALSGLNLDHTS